MTNLTLRVQHGGRGHTEALYWRLAYDSGLAVTEPAEHTSIRTAKPGAAWLQIVRFDLDVIVQVANVSLLPDWRPVFYRGRHADMGPGATAGSALDHVVFGRVRSAELGPIEGTAIENGVGVQHRQFGGQLWLARDGRIVDCPRAAIDPRMIALQGLG